MTAIVLWTIIVTLLVIAPAVAYGPSLVNRACRRYLARRLAQDEARRRHATAQLAENVRRTARPRAAGERRS